MAIETKENLKLSKSDTLDIVGDTGYYSSKELKKCMDDNINAYIPQAKLKLRAEDKDVFPRDKFIYLNFRTTQLHQNPDKQTYNN